MYAYAEPVSLWRLSRTRSGSGLFILYKGGLQRLNLEKIPNSHAMQLKAENLDDRGAICLALKPEHVSTKQAHVWKNFDLVSCHHEADST